MGDPGAKAVLTLHNLCAELEAFIRYRIGQDVSDAELLRRLEKMKEIPSSWWRHFACSGDDHTALGPIEYLREITRSHSRNGMSVSWSQNFVSKIGGFYCEESFFIRGYSTKDLFLKKFLWQLGYESHVHVDAIKLRLLSPCSKEHEGKDESNPAIGKSQQLSKVLRWLESPLDSFKKWASWRFSDRMSGFLPDDGSHFLPVSLGGLSTPAWHMTFSETEDIIINLSSSHLSLIEKVLSGDSTHLDRRVISSFASNSRARGIDADVIQDHVRDLLSNIDLTKAIDVNEIQSIIDVDPDEFKSWTARKKFHVASTHNFISINDAINLIERPYIFRDLLFPDMSEKHGYNPSTSEPYSNANWVKRKRKFNSLLDRQVPVGEAKPLSVNNVARITSCIIDGVILEIPPSNLLISREVVSVESRPNLQTPYRRCDLSFRV
jgi:hypothetical protein